MEFQCKVAELSFGVKTASRALGSGSTLPILAGLKLSVQGSELTLVATDLERAITTSIPIDNQGGDGECVLNGQLLGKITGRLPGDTVSVQMDDAGEVLVIRSGDATFELLLLPLEDYPEVPESPNEPLGQMERERLVRALERTAFAAISARETSRLNLTGVDILTEGSSVKLVATNGYRLALKEEQLSSETPEGEYLVDADALKDLQSILNSLDDETVTIAHGSDHLFVQTDVVTFAVRLIQEEYPDFERVIPSDNSIGLRLNRAAFLDALGRAEITTATESGAVILESRDGALVVQSSSAEKGQAEERVPLLKDADPIKVSFRGEYLIDALRRMTSSEVVLWLKDGESAGLLEPSDGEDDQGFLYVCMPIRMD